ILSRHACEHTEVQFFGCHTRVGGFDDAFGGITTCRSDPTVDGTAVGGEQCLIGAGIKVRLGLPGGSAIHRHIRSQISLELIPCALLQQGCSRREGCRILFQFFSQWYCFAEICFF
ncbi:MAG: hypothetical protein ACK559_39075, partial [bacterium]